MHAGPDNACMDNRKSVCVCGGVRDGAGGVGGAIMRALETRGVEEAAVVERETGVKRSSGNVQKEDYK